MTTSPAPTRLRSLAAWEPSPTVMRRSALAAVIANTGIAFTGAVVRVTSSGLGCPDWPRCTGDSLVPVHSPDHPVLNMAIEFGNRMLGIAVFATVAFCLLVAVRMRPRRRNLVSLAVLLPFGVLLQGIIGGLTVWYALTPGWVTVHFLGTIVMLVLSVWLHMRASEGDGPPQPTMRRELRWLVGAFTAVTVLVLVAGTVVTGSGPHAGDAESVRYPLPVDEVAKLHSGLVWVSVGLLVALLVGLKLTGAQRLPMVRAWQVAAVIAAQAGIGVVQYFTGVPAALVSLHVLGACLLWVVALRLAFATRTRE
ncbi:MAG: heme A synthase [Streptosporangiales bacterium]|nr:heme A synthase [Streptosporangiales bacterium]